jgi:hypothetical protein
VQRASPPNPLRVVLAQLRAFRCNQAYKSVHLRNKVTKK